MSFVTSPVVGNPYNSMPLGGFTPNTTAVNSLGQPIAPVAPSLVQPLALLLFIFLLLTGVAVYIFTNYILPKACKDLASQVVAVTAAVPTIPGSNLPAPSSPSYAPVLL